jgi:hypothetical protein
MYQQLLLVLLAAGRPAGPDHVRNAHAIVICFVWQPPAGGRRVWLPSPPVSTRFAWPRCAARPCRVCGCKFVAGIAGTRRCVMSAGRNRRRQGRLYGGGNLSAAVWPTRGAVPCGLLKRLAVDLITWRRGGGGGGAPGARTRGPPRQGPQPAGVGSCGADLCTAGGMCGRSCLAVGAMSCVSGGFHGMWVACHPNPCWWRSTALLVVVCAHLARFGGWGEVCAVVGHSRVVQTGRVTRCSSCLLPTVLSTVG